MVFKMDEFFPRREQREAVVHCVRPGYDEMEQFFVGTDLEHLRLRGPVRGESDMTTARLPGMTLDTGRWAWGIMTRGSTSGEHTTITIAPDATDTYFNGAPAGRGLIHTYGPNADIVARAPAGTRFAILSVESREIEAAARILGRSVDPVDTGHIDTRAGGTAARFERTVAAFARSVRRLRPGRIDAPTVKRFHDGVLMATLSFLGRGDPVDESRTHLRHQTALEIVLACDAHASERRYRSISSLDLSRVAGYSERRIRSAFREMAGMSPMQFMRTRALHEIRKDLICGAASSVTDSAMEWGFTELGRFAGAYRKAFGELPSETLRDSRRRFGNTPRQLQVSQT